MRGAGKHYGVSFGENGEENSSVWPVVETDVMGIEKIKGFCEQTVLIKATILQNNRAYHDYVTFANWTTQPCETIGRK